MDCTRCDEMTKLLTSNPTSPEEVIEVYTNIWLLFHTGDSMVLKDTHESGRRNPK